MREKISNSFFFIFLPFVIYCFYCGFQEILGKGIDFWMFFAMFSLLLFGRLLFDVLKEILKVFRKNEGL